MAITTEEHMSAVFEELKPIMKRLEDLGGVSVFMNWTPVQGDEGEKLANMAMLNSPKSADPILARSSFISFAVFMTMHVLRKGFPDEVAKLPSIESAIAVALATVGEMFDTKVGVLNEEAMREVFMGLGFTHTPGEDNDPTVH